MQAAKNWCDGERVKKLGIWMASKQGLDVAFAKHLYIYIMFRDKARTIYLEKPE